MPDCQHPIKTLSEMGGDAWGEKIFRCVCGAQLLLDRDIFKCDAPGLARRGMEFARARAGQAETTVADLHNPKPSNLYPFRKAA